MKLINKKQLAHTGITAATGAATLFLVPSLAGTKMGRFGLLIITLVYIAVGRVVRKMPPAIFAIWNGMYIGLSAVMLGSILMTYEAVKSRLIPDYSNFRTLDAGKQELAVASASRKAHIGSLILLLCVYILGGMIAPRISGGLYDEDL